MAQLVYCVTCDEKMSINAKKCPHCGEFVFFSKDGDLDTACPTCSGGGHIQGIFQGQPYGGPCHKCDGKGKLRDMRQKV
mgnify:CR=1 FL=1|jgi:hypothetical protein